MSRSSLTRRLRPLAVMLTVAALALLAACSANTGASSAINGGAGGGGGGQTVKLSGFAFDPATLTISAGTKVTFQNMDGVTHTVTQGKDGTADANALFNKQLPAGQTFEFTFDKAGTYHVTCMIHHQMNMTITVQ